jgi:hypothetical protein
MDLAFTQTKKFKIELLMQCPQRLVNFYTDNMHPAALLLVTINSLNVLTFGTVYFQESMHRFLCVNRIIVFLI